MSDLNFFLIQGLGPGLDGLVVQGLPSNGDYIDAIRLIDRDTVVGDRHPSVQLEKGSLLINNKNLVPTEDPTSRQYDSRNPHGQFVLEGNVRCGSIEVAYSQFERALAVTVLNRVGDTKQTVYSENFLFDFDAVKKGIEAETEKGDLSELVFLLKSIKELEAATQKVKRGETE